MDVQKLRQLADRVSPLTLAIALSALSLVVIVVSTCNTLSADEPLPPPRKAPPPLETTAVVSARFKEGFYRAQVDDDCKTLDIRRLGIDTLRQPNPHGVEYTGGQKLRPGKSLDTASLKLSVRRQKLLIGEDGRGLRTWHTVLRIRNKTDRFIAYRVDTQASTDATEKAELAHNAIALKPKETVQRTEVLTRESDAVKVLRVEVMELTRLGYHYVSRLDPVRLQYDKRTAVGHRYKGLAHCRLLPWREIRDGLRTQTVAWRDVIDFYSRHSCLEYTFFTGYRWSGKGVLKLPVRAKK